MTTLTVLEVEIEPPGAGFLLTHDDELVTTWPLLTQLEDFLLQRRFVIMLSDLDPGP